MASKAQSIKFKNELHKDLKLLFLKKYFFRIKHNYGLSKILVYYISIIIFIKNMKKFKNENKKMKHPI